MPNHVDLSELLNSSHLGAGADNYLDMLYESYLDSPNTIPEAWRNYFNALNEKQIEFNHHKIRNTLIKDSVKKRKNCIYQSPQSNLNSEPAVAAQAKEFINAYRAQGHHAAQLDPLQLNKNDTVPSLELSNYPLLNNIKSVQIEGFNDCNTVDPKSLQASLKDIYCQSIGAEYMHIHDDNEKEWLQLQLESNYVSNNVFTETKKKRLLNKLMQAEGLEHYLHTKYVGQKRFSLEGNESFIIILDELIQSSTEAGLNEIVIGMAHRGRLNVLINVLGKSSGQLFSEFDGKVDVSDDYSGDVKYHMGFSSDIKTNKGQVHVALAFNPSHLEIVSPVVEGSVRARQTTRGQDNINAVLPVLVHGDSSFAGQGVVMETFNMSQLRGYKTGGSLHVVINNQIGFTTSDVSETRSTKYCTDIAKMMDIPVLHVNGDDPEAVLKATQIALAYRMKFAKDIVIDLIGYRKHGHNEADEPSTTQPLMYKAIKQHSSAKINYEQQLLKEGVIDKAFLQKINNDYRKKLDNGEVVIEDVVTQNDDTRRKDWELYRKGSESNNLVNTGVDLAVLKDLASKLYAIPKTFSLQKQLAKVIEQRKVMGQGNQPVDWGFAENLAYASLLNEGYHIRLSGQDSERGTFSHRHSVLHDQKTGEKLINLSAISSESRYEVINSFLSEMAVLAFEYGYSTTDPKTLTLWEAQFGDFSNGAQVVIDQFISSGETKWGRLSGLVMLLPHGLEGMGPEHSSARLERFMQLCAEHNIQVCAPTTSAQIFHLLRRQMLASYRKPLIVMTPKSLLRHKKATSSMSELATGSYQAVIGEIDSQVTSVNRVILCSGKVFYDLLEYREKNDIKNVALIRIEQLYPFPTQELKEILSSYSHVKDIRWCQEEAENQGAWYCILHHLNKTLSSGQHLQYCGRASSASPAVGSAKVHVRQQQTLIEAAFK